MSRDYRRRVSNSRSKAAVMFCIEPWTSSQTEAAFIQPECPRAEHGGRQPQRTSENAVSTGLHLREMRRRLRRDQYTRIVLGRDGLRRLKTKAAHATRPDRRLLVLSLTARQPRSMNGILDNNSPRPAGLYPTPVMLLAIITQGNPLFIACYRRKSVIYIYIYIYGDWFQLYVTRNVASFCRRKAI